MSINKSLLFCLSMLMLSCSSVRTRNETLDKCVKDYLDRGLYADEATNVCEFIYRRVTEQLPFP